MLLSFLRKHNVPEDIYGTVSLPELVITQETVAVTVLFLTTEIVRTRKKFQKLMKDLNKPRAEFMMLQTKEFSGAGK